MTHEHFDFFWFSETNRRPWAEQVALGAKTMRLSLPIGTSVDDAVEQAVEAGMSRGSSRSGCFEIQTDSGIHSRQDGKGFGRLTSDNSVFLAWD